MTLKEPKEIPSWLEEIYNALDLQNYDLGVELIKKRLLQEPGDVLLWLKWVDVEKTNKNYEETRVILTESLKANPDNPQKYGYL